jgi:hypothetical protein
MEVIGTSTLLLNPIFDNVAFEEATPSQSCTCTGGQVYVNSLTKSQITNSKVMKKHSVIMINTHFLRKRIQNVSCFGQKNDSLFAHVFF